MCPISSAVTTNVLSGEIATAVIPDEWGHSKWMSLQSSDVKSLISPMSSPTAIS